MDKIRAIFLVLLLFFSLSQISAQERGRDSLVTLIYASSAHLEEIDGVSFRKVKGPARFFHNNTYLDCDSAVWNVLLNEIDALGNVQVIQDKTSLTGDRMKYIVDSSLVQVRGTLVSLFDRDGNVLNTHFLDYNTKDSTARFYRGGAMKNKDGAVIESNEGEYISAERKFRFFDSVAAYTDSTAIKSDEITFLSRNNTIGLGERTTAWNGENILFTDEGLIDRDSSIFHFTRNGYILTPERELWADDMTYWKERECAHLVNNIQVTDTTQSTILFADDALYKKSPLDVLLTKNPSILSYGMEGDIPDTAYVASDTIHFYAIERCLLDETMVSAALERRELAMRDPVGDSEADAQRKHEAFKQAMKRLNTPQGPATFAEKDSLEKAKMNAHSGEAVSDSVPVPLDSLPSLPVMAPIASDSSSVVVADSSAAVPADTSKVLFVDAWNNVRMFKGDAQGRCDSLVYTGVDSIARLYVEPILWSEEKHQLTADSMQVLFLNGKLFKANMISNAFIASMEDSTHFNQIKGTEMVGFFNNNELCRFDALGGSSLNAYLREDSIITIMNQKEAKIISARIRNKKVERIKYIENIKNNALPVYNLPDEEQKLRGFVWRPELRPASKEEVCNRKVRVSQRYKFMEMKKPEYIYVRRFFPDIYNSIVSYVGKNEAEPAEIE